MFTDRIYIFNSFVHLIIVFGYAGTGYAIPCSRVPQGSGAGRSPSTGNFRIRLSEDSGFYKPGRQYTVFLDRRSNSLRSRDGGKPKFTGFYLAVETQGNTSNDYAEDFSPIKHGTFKVEEDHKTVAKLICGNVVTHTSDTPKSEIQVSWTAPEPGSGCVTFRATVIENRDFWYMDEGQLSKDFCEDEENQEDFISNVLEECCACHEAKYELTFEGLWSRNTHPKGFPRNVYTTKFGDIIGATHKVGNGFWANGEIASEGLKEVAEFSSTRTLESELKNKSDSIRTIIKARGLSYPNITGKTFAVFRVDSENHLVSFVSTISPSPDWFVGVTALELCQPDCTWLESKVVDLYPWDAGTDKGMTYEASDQPARPQEYIRRITSESPNNNESPFYNQSGSKMKPLARLTLLRQRLYEKNCTAEQSVTFTFEVQLSEHGLASDDCQVGEYGPWGECTGAVCGAVGKQYRQRYYKTPDKATKCHRKLFETKSCLMPRCTFENEENVSNDPVCDSASYYTPWSQCTPNCKNSDDEMGTRTRTLKFNRKFFKECAGRNTRPLVQEEDCEIQEKCVGQNQEEEQTTTVEPTEETREEEQTKPTIDCTGTYVKKWDTGECQGLCGVGTRNRTRASTVPECEPLVREEKCLLPPCVNKDFCLQPLDAENCEKDEDPTNAIFYDATTCTCVVFSTFCKKDETTNMFDSFEECRTACPVTEESCGVRAAIPKRPRRSVLSEYIKYTTQDGDHHHLNNT